MSPRWIPLLLAFVLVSFSAHAQNAQMTGRITDPTGAVVPQANVSVVASDTGVRRRVASNQEGYYTVPLLQPGRYEVVVQKEASRPLTARGLNSPWAKLPDWTSYSNWAAPPR